MTLKLASMSCLLGIIGGTIIGIIHTSSSRLIRLLVTIYVTIIRGTPMLIQIFIVRYLFPEIGISLPLFWSAVVAVGLNSSAYVSQIIRLGIDSVPRGQIEAAKVLGFTQLQITRLIVLPQAIRVVIPALGNELVTLVKDSSLASVIGVVELTKEGSILRSTTLDVVTSFAAVGLIYLVMTSTISLGVHWLESRMNSYAQH